MIRRLVFRVLVCCILPSLLLLCLPAGDSYAFYSSPRRAIHQDSKKRQPAKPAQTRKPAQTKKPDVRKTPEVKKTPEVRKKPEIKQVPKARKQEKPVVVKPDIKNVKPVKVNRPNIRRR